MSGSETSSKPAVAIYRHQLFKKSETFIQNQALALKRYRPLFVGESLEGPPPANADFRTVRSGIRPPSAFQWRRYTWLRDPSLFASLIPSDVRLIHAHFGVEGVYALRLARRMRLPLLTTFHGFDATVRSPTLLRSGNPKWMVYALRRGALARSGHDVLAVSEHIRRQLLRLGFPEERIVTHYIGVDTGRIRPPPSPSAEPLIVHVGRLVGKKGTMTLLHAFSRVVKSRPDARLAIVGDGPLRADLEALSSRLELDSRVGFVGAPSDHDDVLGWLRRARVFCLPSQTAQGGDTEGLPISILEAMAAGLPVVATRHAGIPEAVQDGRTGILVPESDEAALADALGRLLDSDEDARRMGAAGRARAEHDFDLGRQSTILEKHYDRACQEGRPGPQTSEAER